ncbi:MAG: hypothetical protein ABR600_08250 [Actinomycetota bacterium]
MVTSPAGNEGLLGSYRTTISAIEAGDRPTLAATWLLSFTSDGTLIASRPGFTALHATYEATATTFTTTDAECGLSVQGVYGWKTEGDSLVLTKMKDACDARAIIFTAHPLTRQA